MCTRFFPISNWEDIANRKALIATYMNGMHVSDSMHVREFMYLSEKAFAIQEEKRKEAEKSNQPRTMS